MNTNDDHHRQHHQRREPVPDRRAAEPSEKSGTPDAVRAAKLTRGDHGQKTIQNPDRRAQGVDWVRPTDLMARHSASLAGRGIDFEVNLARRTRTPLAAGAKRISNRARRLAPASAFGRSQTASTGPSRSSVALSG